MHIENKALTNHLAYLELHKNKRDTTISELKSENLNLKKVISELENKYEQRMNINVSVKNLLSSKFDEVKGELNELKDFYIKEIEIVTKGNRDVILYFGNWCEDY